MRPRISFENETDKTSILEHPHENFLIRFGIAKNRKAAGRISIGILFICICIILLTLRALYSTTDTDDLPPRNPPATDVKRS